jgi:hypothetical protein
MCFLKTLYLVFVSSGLSAGAGVTASFGSTVFSTSTDCFFFNSFITDPVLVLEEKYANVTDVNMKIIAAKVVILFKSGSGPSVPNNV